MTYRTRSHSEQKGNFVIKRLKAPFKKFGDGLHPFSRLCPKDRFKKAKADSRHFKLTSPALWRFALALGLYQLLFALPLIFTPSRIMGTDSWKPIVEVLSPTAQGVMFLFMFFVILLGIPNQWKFAIHAVIIAQTTIWVWWSSIFLIGSLTRDTGTLNGAITYGFLAAIGRVASKEITYEKAR